MRHSDPFEIVSTAEIAAAAEVSETLVRAHIEAGDVSAVDGEFVAWLDAVALARRLRGVRQSTGSTRTPRPVVSLLPTHRRATGVPLAASTALHAAVIGVLALVTTMGLADTSAQTIALAPPQEMRIVYLIEPGPGGGGGGGGVRQRLQPPKAQRKGKSRLSSPLPPRQEPKLPLPAPIEEKPKLEPVKREPLPPIVAPVATIASDTQDKAGTLEETASTADSRGPGSGGGVGTGEGTGIGQGDGPGIGEGEGGGTGGGPYRPGSGIEPPRLLSEVKPQYTEEARRASIEGDVVLEIVVRSNGSVGEVRVLQGLGQGLDRRAVEAVRQWRFSPARRRGAPVDVMVEVAVEFRLR